MHEAQIMHRDLKPENILLDLDLHLKVVSIIKNLCKHVQIDFGDAKQFKSDVHTFVPNPRAS